MALLPVTSPSPCPSPSRGEGKPASTAVQTVENWD